MTLVCGLLEMSAPFHFSVVSLLCYGGVLVEASTRNTFPPFRFTRRLNPLERYVRHPRELSVTPPVELSVPVRCCRRANPNMLLCCLCSRRGDILSRSSMGQGAPSAEATHIGSASCCFLGAQGIRSPPFHGAGNSPHAHAHTHIDGR